MSAPLLLLETSGRGGRVGLHAGGVLRERPLDPARRHARDLAPAVADLLAESGLTPRDVWRVGVSVGPGSFTGLRVGVMSAKAFAFAAGCELVAVPTFAALADGWADPATTHLHVVADGLQGLIYHEGFERAPAGWRTVTPLRLLPARDWATGVSGAVTGPGLAVVESLLPADVARVAAAAPTLAAMLAVARRLPPLTRDELFGLEPLYLRGSSAEELAAKRQREQGERGA